MELTVFKSSLSESILSKQSALSARRKVLLKIYDSNTEFKKFYSPDNNNHHINIAYLNNKIKSNKKVKLDGAINKKINSLEYYIILIYGIIGIGIIGLPIISIIKSNILFSINDILLFAIFILFVSYIPFFIELYLDTYLKRSLSKISKRAYNETFYFYESIIEYFIYNDRSLFLAQVLSLALIAFLGAIKLISKAPNILSISVEIISISILLFFGIMLIWLLRKDIRNPDYYIEDKLFRRYFMNINQKQIDIMVINDTFKIRGILVGIGGFLKLKKGAEVWSVDWDRITEIISFN